jgi:phosphate uptake regulator
MTAQLIRSISSAQLILEDLKDALADPDPAKARRVTTIQQQLDDLADALMTPPWTWPPGQLN